MIAKIYSPPCYFKIKGEEQALQFMEIITESQFFRNIKWVCDGSLLYELTTEENIDREILIYVDKTNILYSSGRRITNQSIVIEGENMDNIFLR